jgi:hypothetical protein
MMVIVEKLVERRLAGETEVLGENLPQLSTTNPTWLDPGSNPGRRGGKPATNCLGYGATSLMCLSTSDLVSASKLLEIFFDEFDMGNFH